ncbi:MAG: PEP/pyruvate-binding domain-containing protein [Usitatibacter sp.]
MSWLTDLERTTVRDRLQLGGKAVSLARLMEIGYPVPSTLVISAEVVSGIVSAAQNPERLDIPRDLTDEIAQKTRTWRRYCVRSSSVHEDSDDQAWAGVLKSCVDIGFDEVEDSIREVISSLYSPASLKYAMSRSVCAQDLKIAIILQEYVDGQVSGVGFSIDPVNHYENAVVLEVAEGPAEKLTEGSIVPDRYVIEKANGRILDARPGQSRGYAVSRATVIDVASQITRLEQAFGCAIDVEWTIDNGVFVPLQARPITTSRPFRDVAAKAPQSYRFWWLDHDARWQFELGILSLETDRDVSANRLTDVIYVREDGSTRCLISADDTMRLSEVGVELRSMTHFQRFRAESIQSLNRAEDVRRALGETEIKQLGPAQICLHLQAIEDAYRRCSALYRTCDPYATNAIFAAASRFIPVEKLFALVAQPNEIRERESRDWRALVEQDFDEAAAWKHVRTYPWLVPNLFTRDAILTTLREKHRVSQDLYDRPAPDSAETDEMDLPDSVRDILFILRGLSDLRLRLKMAWASFDFFFVDLYEAISRHTRVPIRELRDCHPISSMIALLGNEASPTADAPALAHLHDGKVAFVSAEHAGEFWRHRSVLFDHADDTNANDEIRGTVANHGKISGRVHILSCNDVDKANRVRAQMLDGDVLVSEMIQFNVMDLVQRAGGLITDEGGMLSHAAILAREMGIPCIVGTQRATQMLRDGDRVTIDTKAGWVKRVDPAFAVAD